MFRNNQTFTLLLFTVESKIVNFTANENTSTIIVHTNSSVRFSCEAEGNPSPSLSLRKDGQQLTHYSNSTQKFNLSLKFDKNITECRDAGVYSCQAVTGQATVNKTVDVNVKCKYQLENTNIENMVYKARINNAKEISIPVFGYPEPTLHLDCDTILDTKTYSLTYTNQRPSYGVVSLQIYTVTEVVFQSYRLNITNSEGSLVFNFQIREGDPDTMIPSEGADPTIVGAIVGGVVAGILVIVAVVLVVVFLKRKGHLSSGVHKKNSDTNMQIPLHGEQKDPHYVNISQELPKDDPRNSPDEEIRVVPSHSSHEEIRDVPSQSPYEDMRDVPAHSPYEEMRDIPSHYANEEIRDVPSQSPHEEMRDVPSHSPFEEIRDVPSQFPYEEIRDLPLHYPYEEIRDVPSHSSYVELKDAPPNSPYEEIGLAPPRPQYENSIDFMSDRPDNLSDHTDIFSHSHRGEVHYENTVPAW